MKILSKRGEKDYYDYISGIYGIDDTVVYDRRKSHRINDIIGDFGKNVMATDGVKRVISHYWRARSFRNYDKVKKRESGFTEGNIFHFIIDCGYYRYVFEGERYLKTPESKEVDIDYLLLNKFRIKRNKNNENVPIILYYGDKSNRSYLFNDKPEPEPSNFYGSLENPLLKDTPMPSFVSAEEVWRNLYEYLSSLKDKEIFDGRTDEEHIESAGMDKKASFRNLKHRIK